MYQNSVGSCNPEERKQNIQKLLICFLFCLVENRRSKPALLQDPEFERYTADITFLGFIQLSHPPAMTEMTANILQFYCRREPISFRGLKFHFLASKRMKIDRDVEVSAGRVWQVDQVFFCLTR